VRRASQSPEPTASSRDSTVGIVVPAANAGIASQRLGIEAVQMQGRTRRRGPCIRHARHTRQLAITTRSDLAREHRRRLPRAARLDHEHAVPRRTRDTSDLGTVPRDDELDLRHRHVWQGRRRLHIGYPHVHGANFGIRADTYVELGGWPAVASGEEVATAYRVAASRRLRIVRTAAIRVTTSSRVAARAPDGFAGYLRELLAETAAAESRARQV
jgi:hypothetical protein